MTARLLGYATVVGGLLLMLAAALWLPTDLGRAGDPEPASPASELAGLPGDCAMFVTMRPADFLGDELAKVFSEQLRLWSDLERSFDVKAADVERFTMATVAGDNVQIVRTRKLLDQKKLLAGLERDRGYKGYKDKDGGKMEVSEKKIGGKTVYSYGPGNRWTTGLCVLERKVVVRGSMRALESFLGSKVKQSPELKALVAEGRKHSMVVGIQGKTLRTMINQEFRRYSRDSKEGIAKDSKPKDKGPGDRTKEKEKEPPLLLPFEAMPYKPLMMMKTAIVTVDVGDGYTARGKAVFASKETADEAEHAARTLLYVFRELAATAPDLDPGLRPLAPVMESVQKAFRSAKIVRKGNTLETSVRLTVSKELGKKLGAEMATERKRIEEERKNRYRDKDVRKDGFKDKK